MSYAKPQRPVSISGTRNLSVGVKFRRVRSTYQPMANLSLCSAALQQSAAYLTFDRAISKQDLGIGVQQPGEAGQDSGDQFQVLGVIQKNS